jgi:hypothetical protein
MLVPAALQGQVVVEDWIVTGGSGAASGNGWIDATSNVGRGIDFIAADATQNTFDADLVAVLTGTAATADVQMLRASDGFNFGKFATQATGDATLDKYRLATSEDGYIFVNGFSGTVQRYTMTGTRETVVTVADYAAVTPPITGASRALEVTGNVELGTAKIFVGKGSNVIVFANTPATPDDFNYIGQFPSGYASGDVAFIGSHDGINVYAGLSTSVAMKKYVVAVTPAFSVTAGTDVVGYAGFAKNGVAVNADNSLGAVAESGGPQDGFGIGDISAGGLTWVNILPAAGLDGDGDLLYDAGAINMDAANAVVDVAMDPATGNVYGYSSNTAASATAPASSGSVFRLSVDDTSSVSDWTLY